MNDDTTWDLFADIEAINAWLDLSNLDKMDAELDNSTRVMKIGEEFGEAVAAYIGMTGQNPRKGFTHSRHDLMMELADVAVAALAAIQHFTQSSAFTKAILASKIDAIMKRIERV